MAEFHEDSSTGHSLNIWGSIWRMRVQPRVALLIWKLAWGILPTRWRLHSKGMHIDLACSFCKTAVETPHHLFLDCRCIMNLWKLLGLHLSNTEDITCARHWLRILFESLSSEECQRLAYGLLYIWDNRNATIFNNIYRDDATLATRTLKAVERYEAALEEHKKSRPHQYSSAIQCRWQKPQAGHLKINFDASLVEGEEGVGLGVIIRDCMGDFVIAYAIYIAACWTTLLGEAEACKQSLIIAQRHHFTSCIEIEGDSQFVIQQLLDRTIQFGPARHTLDDVLALHSDMDSTQFKWLPRTCNAVADRLARWARLNKTDGFWEHAPPPWLFDLLITDSHNA